LGVPGAFWFADFVFQRGDFSCVRFGSESDEKRFRRDVNFRATPEEMEPAMTQDMASKSLLLGFFNHGQPCWFVETASAQRNGTRLDGCAILDAADVAAFLNRFLVQPSRVAKRAQIGPE
jgi:hypothetical protein